MRTFGSHTVRSDDDWGWKMHGGLTAAKNGLSGGRYSPHHLWEGSSKHTRPRDPIHQAMCGRWDRWKTASSWDQEERLPSDRG